MGRKRRRIAISQPAKHCSDSVARAGTKKKRGTVQRRQHHEVAAAATGAVAVPAARSSNRMRFHDVSEYTVNGPGTFGFFFDHGRHDTKTAAPCCSSSVDMATALAALTPVERDVLELKKAHRDALLMVEIGYVCRFFGEDAELAGRLLGICVSRPKRTGWLYTASVPIYRRHVHLRTLVEAGLQVAVVKQEAATTPTTNCGTARVRAGAAAVAAFPASAGRKASGKKFVRSISALYTRSTIATCVDEESVHMEEMMGSSFLVVMHESQLRNVISLAAYEPCTGRGFYDSFMDDPGGSALHTRLFQLRPVDMLVLGRPRCSDGQNSRTKRIRNSSGYDAVEDGILSDASFQVLREYQAHEKRIKGTHACMQIRYLPIEEYREVNCAAAASSLLMDNLLSAGDANNNDRALMDIMSLGPNVIVAFAMMVKYLKRCGLIHIARLCGRRVAPLASWSAMRLNYIALRCLDVVSVEPAPVEHKPVSSFGEDGSLLHFVGRTTSPAGARLMRTWVTQPLQDRLRIEERLDAVTELIPRMSLNDDGGYIGKTRRNKVVVVSGAVPLLSPCWVTSVEAYIRRMGDLEFELQLARSVGSYPPSRFIKILDVLHGAANCIPLNCRMTGNGKQDTTNVDGPQSPLLVSLLCAVEQPRLYDAIVLYGSMLNSDAAMRGDMCNLFCDDAKYSRIAETKSKIAHVMDKLALELHHARMVLKQGGCRTTESLDFTSLHQYRFLIEVKRQDRIVVPATWTCVSETKAALRFHTRGTEVCLVELDRLEAELEIQCAQAWNQFRDDFFKSVGALCQRVTSSFSELDCVFALARVSRAPHYCRPQFRWGGRAVVHLSAARDPILECKTSKQYISNDVNLSVADDFPRMAIITGPNMGGKSCYVRMVALNVMLAHIGCYVPADHCEVSVVDGIYVRMGATDNIFEGKSTFFMEMSDTSDILRHATESSLVILDELGRGTSTHDGVSIGVAVAEHLLLHTQCLVLMVTHYHALSALPLQYPGGGVKTYHMSFVQQENGAIVFLYKLVPDSHGDSYGINVAKMCEMPQSVVDRAHAKAQELRHCAASCPRGDAATTIARFMSQEAHTSQHAAHPAERRACLSRLLALQKHAAALFAESAAT